MDMTLVICWKNNFKSRMPLSVPNTLERLFKTSMYISDVEINMGEVTLTSQPLHWK